MGELAEIFARADKELQFGPYEDFSDKKGTHSFSGALTYYIL